MSIMNSEHLTLAFSWNDSFLACKGSMANQDNNKIASTDNNPATIASRWRSLMACDNEKIINNQQIQWIYSAPVTWRKHTVPILLHSRFHLLLTMADWHLPTCMVLFFSQTSPVAVCRSVGLRNRKLPTQSQIFLWVCSQDTRAPKILRPLHSQKKNVAQWKRIGWQTRPFVSTKLTTSIVPTC